MIGFTKIRVLPLYARIRWDVSYADRKKVESNPQRYLREVLEGKRDIKLVSTFMLSAIRGQWRKLPEHERAKYPEIAQVIADRSQEILEYNRVQAAQYKEKRQPPAVITDWLYSTPVKV